VSQDGKGYLVPEPASPYEFECFRVYVPRHTLYVGAFWQAYQFFTSWLAWARDPLHRGKQAAEIWREAYNKARAVYEVTKGQCEMNVTGIRQNPNNKCELQVEFDGNNQWVTVADMKDCRSCGGGGAMQFDGVNVTVYNDCDQLFEPSAEPFNPIVKGIYDSVYTPSTQAACNGAANIAKWLKYVSDQSLSIMATAGVAGAGASFIIGALATSAGAMFLLEALIGSLFAEIESSAGLLDDAAVVDISTEMQNILALYMNDDGTIREPQFTEAVNALYARRDEEAVDTAARVRWGHETNILSALGPYVISRQNKYAGITDADCSSAGWAHTFDFTIDRQGWVRSDVSVAVYHAGEGWGDDLLLDGFGHNYRGVAIKIACATTTIKSVKIYYTATLGVNEDDDEIERRQVQWFKNAQTAPNLVDDADTEAGEVVYAWAGEVSSVDAVVLGMTVGFDGVDPMVDPGGEARVTRVVLTGIGSDPFV
jgi:hypothetical protein